MNGCKWFRMKLLVEQNYEEIVEEIIEESDCKDFYTLFQE